MKRISLIIGSLTLVICGTACVVNERGQLVPLDPLGRAVVESIENDYDYNVYQPREVVVASSMPRPIYEPRPTLVTSYADPVFIDGHYYWNGADWVWRRGRWVNRPRPGVTWREPVVITRGGRRYYRGGYWG